MITIGILYIALLALGVFFALISGFFGWLGDLGDADIHVDASGHLDAGHPSPISATTIATFITGFGAGGTLAHYLFQWERTGSLVFATGSGLVLAVAAFLILDLIFSQTQAGSEFGADAVVGREAEVITPIPQDGTGEVAFAVKGQRESAPARSLDGSPLPRGRLVVIERVAGSTLYVRPVAVEAASARRSS